MVPILTIEKWSTWQWASFRRVRLFYFRVIFNSNGQTMVSSQGYRTLAAREHCAQLLANHLVVTPEIVDLDKSDAWPKTN